MILEKIAKQLGIQPAVRNVLADIAVVEEETPKNGAVADGTKEVGGNDYSIESPVGDDFNGYEFTLISSEDADSKVVIAETEDEEYSITAGNDADADDVESALEEKFGGDWTVTADNSQTGSDFDDETITLTDGVNATAANKGELRFDSDKIYVASKDIDISTTDGWVEISHSVVS